MLFTYSLADNAAIVPSATAVVICLYLLETQSPAAKTPGIFVTIKLSTTISLNLFSSKIPENLSVFGMYPINIKTPSIFCISVSELFDFEFLLLQVFLLQ